MVISVATDIDLYRTFLPFLSLSLPFFELAACAPLLHAHCVCVHSSGCSQSQAQEPAGICKMMSSVPSLPLKGSSVLAKNTPV